MELTRASNPSIFYVIESFSILSVYLRICRYINILCAYINIPCTAALYLETA